MTRAAAHNTQPTEPAMLPDRILRRSSVARYLPTEMVERIPERIQVRITAAVRHRLRRPERIPVADWAEFREVTEGAHPGKWRHEFAPHCVHIMNTFGLPWVREIWFCGVEQSGKTNTMLNCVCWAIEQDPGNIFYLMPTKDDSDKIIGGKLKPTLQKTKRLKKYLSKKQDDMSFLRINLKHGMTIYPAHSNSASSMATWAAKYCFGDEVDKYPKLVGKEADPITLIKKRNRTYKGRYKRFFSSTCGDGKYIYSGMEACHQIWEYSMRCPDCGTYVRPGADNLVLPEGATPESVERDPGSIGLACPECHEKYGTIWGETERESAIRNGRWRARKGGDLPRPAKVGFHHRAWECLDVPLYEIAAAYLKAQTGDLAAKIAWANGYEAIDYEPETTAAREGDHLLRYHSGLPRNAVPLDTAMLGLLADTQQDSFYYELWAYGYSPEIDMRMIRHGILPSFADLEYLLHQEVFVDADGKEYRVQIGMIDSGGTRKGWQKHSRTVEVYDWCSKHRIMIPLKGIWSRRDGSMISYKNVETLPGTNKRIPGGLVRADLKVDYFKDELSRRLNIEPDDPGALLYHDDIDEAFAKHYTAEVKDEETGEWKHDKKKGRNDFWDCNVYAIALREILKTRIPRKADDRQVRTLLASGKKQTIASRSTAPSRTLPSWYLNR